MKNCCSGYNSKSRGHTLFLSIQMQSLKRIEHCLKPSLRIMKHVDSLSYSTETDENKF